MGWTGITNNFNTREEIKTFIDSEYTWQTEEYRNEVIKSSLIGNTWYGAIKKTNKKTKEIEVWAGICLISIKKKEFWYKNMDETVGPYKYECPINILNLLTETKYEFAKQWRQNCLEYHKINKQLKTFLNKTVKLKADYNLKWGNYHEIKEGETFYVRIGKSLKETNIVEKDNQTDSFKPIGNLTLRSSTIKEHLINEIKKQESSEQLNLI